jgi:hypothetical protein
MMFYLKVVYKTILWTLLILTVLSVAALKPFLFLVSLLVILIYTIVYEVEKQK